METLQDLQGRTGLMIASTGGHLAQIVRWSERLAIGGDSKIVTFDTPQSRSLLSPRTVVTVPYVAPRDWKGILRASFRVADLLKNGEAEFVLSTGAGLALSCLPSVLWRRIPFHYIESVSRVDGPSTTGQILERVPTIQTWTQHKEWARPKWPYAGSILDDYVASSTTSDARPDSLKLFVTLGTIQPYRFDRLVDRVLQIIGPADRVTWQLGSTSRVGLPGVCSDYLTRDDFQQAAREADAVVAQAGVGGIVDLLDMGISPVTIPRRKQFSEHVDDHQLQAARVFSKRGLATYVEASDLRREHLIARPIVQRGSALRSRRF